eukprot:jgi/Chrzof1/2056/Cz11g01090.t1
MQVAYGTSGILTGSPAFGVTWEPASLSKIPILVDVDAANPACKVYVAKKGDYISKVAKMFNVELEALLLDNQRVILDLDEPLEGKTLRLCSVPASKYKYLQALKPRAVSADASLGGGRHNGAAL